MQKIKMGISSCLLGWSVRYDGGHKLDHYLAETLGQYVQWVPVCPEVEYGLPVPREPMRLVGEPGSARLVTVRTGVDHTAGMLAWTRKRLSQLEGERLAGFVFKRRSPSSGIGGVKIYGKDGRTVRRGTGIFGGEFMRRFPLVPVEDDGRLQDPRIRENFIERVFVYRRWQEAAEKGIGASMLVDFHTSHKLLVLAHSPRHYSELGRMVASAKRKGLQKAGQEYITTLMGALRLMATVKKNTNVLMHMAGYFKKQLDPDDRKELLEVIDAYHRGLVPLIVPITLLRHYVRKFDEPYLKKQHYLNPHPIELMLRNHV